MAAQPCDDHGRGQPATTEWLIHAWTGTRWCAAAACGPAISTSPPTRRWSPASSARELREARADALVREVERSTVLFIQGEGCDRFYVLPSGWVRLFRQTAGGREVTIALFTTGESLAEAATLAGGRFPVSALAADRCRRLLVPRSRTLRQIE
jgi:CRP-like cAMP-binding protein